MSLNQANLNPKKYTNIKIAIPDLSEQVEIVSYIEEKSRILNRTIKQAKSEIKLSKEYLNSLIYQVVTGQLKVPE